MKKYIGQVGPSKVRAIVTDDAANMRKARKIVVALWSHILQLP